MASKLKQLLQSKATLASEFLSKHGTTYYKQLLEQNKQYIQEPATVEKCNELSKQLFYARLARFIISKPATVEKCNELSKQLFYTRLASLPRRSEAFWKELEHVKELWKNKEELQVGQVGIATLFELECWAWFWAGKIVGRGFTFTGYDV